jgi:hypothetical protein
VVEVGVVVKHGERRRLGNGGNEEVRNSASSQAACGERSLDLTGAIEVVCFDLDATERTEGGGQAIPIVTVAR